MQAHIQSLTMCPRRMMQHNFRSSNSIHIDTQDLMRQQQIRVEIRLTSLEEDLRAVRINSDNMQQYLLNIGVTVSRRLDSVTQAVNTLGVVALHGAAGIRRFGTSVLGLLTNMHSTIMGRLERPLHLGPSFTFEDYLGVEFLIITWTHGSRLRGRFKASTKARMAAGVLRRGDSCCRTGRPGKRLIEMFIGG